MPNDIKFNDSEAKTGSTTAGTLKSTAVRLMTKLFAWSLAEGALEKGLDMAGESLGRVLPPGLGVVAKTTLMLAAGPLASKTTEYMEKKLEDWKATKAQSQIALVPPRIRDAAPPTITLLPDIAPAFGRAAKPAQKLAA